METGKMRSRILCGLLATVMVMACACEKGGSGEAGLTPTAEVTKEVTPGTENPTPTGEEPSVTPSVSAEPTLSVTAEPSGTVTPTGALTMPETAVLTPMVMPDSKAAENTYDVLRSDPVAGAERGTVSNLLVRYIDKNGEVAMFDSLAYAERMQESSKSRSEELCKELAARYQGKPVVFEKLLEKIEVGDSWQQENAYINVYEHAVYCAPTLNGDGKNDPDLPMVFTYQVDFLFSDGGEIHGVICSEQKPINKTAETVPVTVDFHVRCTYEFPDNNEPMKITPVYTEVRMRAQTPMGESDADRVLSNVKDNTVTAYVAPSGKTVLYSSKKSIPYGESEIVRNVVIQAADGTVLYSEGEKDVFLKTTMEDIRKSFKIFDADGKVYPVPGFEEKVTHDDAYQSDAYKDTYDLGEGLKIWGEVWRSGVTDDYPIASWHFDGMDSVDVYAPVFSQKENTYGYNLNTLYTEEYWSDRDEVFEQLAILHLTAKDKDNRPYAEFQSERYAAEHKETFENSALVYKKELQAAFKDNILVREKLLETIPFENFGELVVTEHAAIGYAESEDNSILFSYSVQFCFRFTNGSDMLVGTMFVQRDRWNEGDSYDAKADCQYDEEINVTRSVLHGDPVTTVTCVSNWISPENYSYSDKSFYNIAYFDGKGKAILYEENSWGEATDWHVVPGDQKFIRPDGKVIFSKKDNILFGYRLSDLAENLKRLETLEDPADLQYTVIPKGSIRTKKNDDGDIEVTFSDSVSLGDDVSIVFTVNTYAESFFHYYTIKMMYKGAELSLEEDRFEADDTFYEVTDEFRTTAPAVITVEHTDSEYFKLALAEAEEASYRTVEEEVREDLYLEDFRFALDYYHRELLDHDVPWDLRCDQTTYNYRRSFLDENGNYRKTEYYLRNEDGTYREVARSIHGTYGSVYVTPGKADFTVDYRKYDDKGNIVYEQDKESIYTYAYDDAGRLLTKARYSTSGMLWDQCEYTYDKNGRLAEELGGRYDSQAGRITGKYKNVYSYKFDDKNRLLSVSIDQTGTDTWEIPRGTYTFTYKEDGTVLCTEDTGRTWKHARVLRPSEADWKILRGETVVPYIFESSLWDTDNVMKEGTVTVEGGQWTWSSVSENKEYKDDRLMTYTSYDTTGDKELYTQSYSYDAEGRVLTELFMDRYIGSDSAYTCTYTYDENNRIAAEKIDYISKKMTANYSEEHTYTYGAKGERSGDTATVRLSDRISYRVMTNRKDLSNSTDTH